MKQIAKRDRIHQDALNIDGINEKRLILIFNGLRDLLLNIYTTNVAYKLPNVIALLPNLSVGH